MTWEIFKAQFQQLLGRKMTDADIIAIKKALGLPGKDAQVGQLLRSRVSAMNPQQAAGFIGQLKPAAPISGPGLGGAVGGDIGGKPDFDNGDPGGLLPSGMVTGPTGQPITGTPGGGWDQVAPPFPSGTVTQPVPEVDDDFEDPCPDGWHYDKTSKKCVKDEDEEEEFDNDLFAEFSEMLSDFGLSGMEDLLERAVREDWGTSQFLMEMRKHPTYLANPLYAANLQRAANGGGFLSEGQVIAWRNGVQELGRQFGYQNLSDNYLAQGLLAGLSAAELEHRFRIQDNINTYGAGVRAVFETELGISITDDDLYEIFDPEFDTKDYDDAYQNALYRGRPFALGLGIRSQAEADALKMLGVDPNEAFKRWEDVSLNAPRFERLGAIEDLITQGLPESFGDQLGTQENSLLVKGLVFNDPKALAELQGFVSREIGRFKVGGGPATNNRGQAVGLLTRGE